MKGQARWLKNDAVLSISNASQVALNAFNALSTVTGQYFMVQVNTNLLDIKDGIDDIKQYIDAVKQSESVTAIQELYEIIEHIRFIKNDSERVRTILNQIVEIRRVAKKDINFYKKQIEKIMREVSNSDKEIVIKNNIEELRKTMVQYHYAVYLYNLAQILKIYLNNIIDVEELNLYRNEISDIVNQYKGVFDKATKWARHYIDETNSLNKVSKKQKVLTFGSGLFGDVLGRKIGNYELAGQVKAGVNDRFDNDRKKKKETYNLSIKEFQSQMNDLVLIDSSISVMDRYIDLTSKKAGIVSVDGECFIKYIEEE